MDDAPSHSYRNVRLATLRLAVAAAGFSPADNHIDKIIGDNVQFHRHSLARTQMSMSAAVVARIQELAGPSKPPADPATVSTETPPPVIGTKAPFAESTAPIVESTAPVVETETSVIESTPLAVETAAPAEPELDPLA